MWGVVPVREQHYEPVVKEVQQFNHNDRFLAAMATCHSLTIIGGEIAGDPLDVIMFQFTGWVSIVSEIIDLTSRQVDFYLTYSDRKVVILEKYKNAFQ